MSNSNVKIQSTSHGVRVIDVNIGDIIRIYTTDGVLHHYERADSQTIDIPLTKNDVYIIKVGGKTAKIRY